MAKTVLLSTLHDPQGTMIPFLTECLPPLMAIYEAMNVIATPNTHPDTAANLETAGVRVWRDGTPEIGANRRRTLRQGLEHYPLANYFHYCDFDRLLHWQTHYPDELRDVVKYAIPNNDYVALGRTPRAFETHPRVQREAEGLTNEVFSHVFGRPNMDVVAGSCALSRAVAQTVLTHSIEPSNATDTEWPMIVKCIAPTTQHVVQLTVEGLEFETATFYGETIYAQSENPDNWCRRMRLARDSIAAAIRVQTTTPQTVPV